ncbi:MAG TPA: ASKHA domain-containing protein [Spirochaetia bacterium]|nr:ASKHA domain-containing protein [Spirochaetia bacterium]
MTTARVTFWPAGVTTTVPLATTLLEAARQAGVPVDAVCGGKGTCGKCAARLLEGQLSEESSSERDVLPPGQQAQGFVLLCQRKVLGDAMVETQYGPETGGDPKSAKEKYPATAFSIDPHVIKTIHRLDPPDLEDQTADMERVLAGLAAPVQVDIGLAARLPELLRDAGFQVTSVIEGGALISLEPGDTTTSAYGLAVDVGTTTVAVYLVDLLRGRVLASASAPNRQAAYGADVITRITHTMENPGGLAEMQKLVRETVDEIIARLLAQTGVPADSVYLLTFVGNTVMSHLLLGISPRFVAAAPFIPAFCRDLSGTAAQLGLQSLPGYVRFRTLPNIAGYIGADTVGVMLATGIYDLPGVWLAVDIGTNGEIILSRDGRLYTCSTAAGPVFEGASIKQGMRAESGAIYQVRVADDCHVRVIGDTPPRGICGSGLIDVVAELVRLAVINKNGRLKKPGDLPSGLPGAVQRRIVADGKGTRFILAEGPQEIALTQGDISQLQLAKAAIRAGIEILLEEAGLKASALDGIMLAGAFGSNLDPASLLGIGLLPAVNPAAIKAVGNAAGIGAIKALLSGDQFALAGDLAKRAKHLELSAHHGFNKQFARWLLLEKPD